MNASRMWLRLLLDVVSYENDHWSDGQLLSEAVDHLIEKSPVVGRALILGAGAVLTLHLANVLDYRYDPLSKRFWKRGLA